MSIHDVLIVGAGPSGLATAIAAKQRGLDYALIEKGVLVNSIFNFPTYMVFFTTPELLEIGGLPLITPYEKPTRLEALRYYRRVVDAYDLQVSYGEEVMSVASPEMAPHAEGGVFRVTTRLSGILGPVAGTVVGDGFTRPDAQRVHCARAVVLAIGYYEHPNYLGVRGEELPHVSHYYTDAHPYYRRRVVVVGGKNSAAEAALELFRAGAHVTLVHRRPALGASIKYWVRPDIENRIKEGSIAARFDTCVVEIRPDAVVVERSPEADGTDARRGATREEIPADAVFLLTGYHPDVDLMQRAGIQCDAETLAPDLDPETYETNVANLFIAGGAIAGRNTGSIFIENGRFHGERIITTIAPRLQRER